MSGLRIAILGTRGVPPKYGGFETFAAQLGKRLASRGHEITVYCRRALYEDEPAIWEGIRRVELPAVGHKYLETVSHAFFSALHAVFRRFDVILVCNAANAFILPVLAAARMPTVLNVDGIERQRRKWNILGRGVYMIGESLSAHFATRIVADAGVIADYYGRRHGVRPEVLAYGSSLEERDSDILDRLSLSPQKFVLYVSRFEPENNPLEVVRAWSKVRTDLPLVMVGDAPYSGDLIARIRAEADERVIFPGALYGADYATLQRNALAYIQATEVGGTHPALIEAMGVGGAIVANGTPENREVGADAVEYFDFHGLPRLETVLQRALDHPGSFDEMRRRAKRRASEVYDWERVTDGYEALFDSVVQRT